MMNETVVNNQQLKSVIRFHLFLPNKLEGTKEWCPSPVGP